MQPEKIGTQQKVLVTEKSQKITGIKKGLD